MNTSLLFTLAAESGDLLDADALSEQLELESRRYSRSLSEEGDEDLR